MPLHLNDEEMSLLLSLAQPIDQRQRTQFLTEFTTAIEQEAARTSVGPSLVHRVARTVQRRFFFDPPQPPNASPRFRSRRDPGRSVTAGPLASLPAGGTRSAAKPNSVKAGSDPGLCHLRARIDGLALFT
jgi:hypothetical protein